MKCDLIIISYNTRELVVKCIESAIDTADSLIENIIVVDNNSKDDTVEIVKNKFSNVKIIINDDNFGYSKAVNIGVAASTSELVLISNSDILFLDDSIANLIKLFSEDERIAVAGVRQVYPDGTWQYSYGDFPNYKTAILDLFLLSNMFRALKKFRYNKLGKDEKLKEVDYADGGLIATRRADFDAVSGFDEDYFFYSEDMDFCYKIKQNNGKVVFTPDAKVVHLRGASSSRKFSGYKSLRAILESKMKFAKKHLSKSSFFAYSIAQIIRSFLLFILVFPFKFISHKADIFVNYHKATTSIWYDIARKLV